jgi:S1-C subfamily serine protease
LLRENDVILKFDGKNINNLNDLQKATNQADFSKHIEILVFRNQKELVVTVLGEIFQ